MKLLLSLGLLTLLYYLLLNLANKRRKVKFANTITQVIGTTKNIEQATVPEPSPIAEQRSVANMPANIFGATTDYNTVTKVQKSIPLVPKSKVPNEAEKAEHLKETSSLKENSNREQHTATKRPKDIAIRSAEAIPQAIHTVKNQAIHTDKDKITKELNHTTIEESDQRAALFQGSSLDTNLPLVSPASQQQVEPLSAGVVSSPNTLVEVATNFALTQEEKQMEEGLEMLVQELELQESTNFELGTKDLLASLEVFTELEILEESDILELIEFTQKYKN